MISLLKKLHKWIGLLIGLQLLLWLLSGLTISLLDPAKVSGQQWANPLTEEPQVIQSSGLLEPYQLASDQLNGALGVDLTLANGQAIYRVKHATGDTLLSALDGSIIKTDKAAAEKLAQQDFSGDGHIISTKAGVAPDMETRHSAGAYWKVSFSDSANTAVYISASTGDILERRNRYWRVRDFFWMLHIMDYTGRENFNNPVIISTVLIAIWLAISGFMLLSGSFKRHDFYFLNVLGRRNQVTVTLLDPAATRPVKLTLRKGSNLFLSLANHDIQLPSICGGGGECGKCRVKMESPDLPVATRTEEGLIPRPLREQGYRLACQHQVENNITLHLARDSLPITDDATAVTRGN